MSAHFTDLKFLLCFLIFVDDIPDEPILDFDELNDALDATTTTPKNNKASVKKSRNAIPFAMGSLKVCNLCFI